MHTLALLLQPLLASSVSHEVKSPSRTQAGRTTSGKQVTRAAIEWYGPDRAKWLGPFSDGAVPDYLSGEFAGVRHTPAPYHDPCKLFECQML